MKKPWLSKTLWVNAFSIAAMLVPGVSEVLSTEQFVAILGAVNIILRLVTKDEITMIP